MKQTKHFKRTALSKSAKSMVSLMLLLIVMLVPQGAWAGACAYTPECASLEDMQVHLNGTNGNFNGSANNEVVASLKFNYWLDIFNYDGDNGYWDRDLTMKIDGQTLTFYSDYACTTKVSTDYSTVLQGVWGVFGDSNEDHTIGKNKSGSGNKAYFKTSSGLKGYINIYNYYAASNKWTTMKVEVFIYDLYGHKVSVCGTYKRSGKSDIAYDYVFYLGGCPRPKNVTTSQSTTQKEVTISWQKETYSIPASDATGETRVKAYNVIDNGNWGVYRNDNYTTSIQTVDNTVTSAADNSASCSSSPYTYNVCYEPKATYGSNGTSLKGDVTSQRGISGSSSITLTHVWSNSGSEKDPATCTTAAVHYQTCIYCSRTSDDNHTYTSGSALGHSLTATPAKAVTCTEAGNNAYWTCSTCKKVFSNSTATTETTVAAQTIAALGHGSTGYTESYVWTGNAYNDESQDTKACTFTLTCNKCSTKVVNGASLTCTKTAHVDASCTETGSTTYQATGSYTSSNSTYNYSKTVTNAYTVAALGHLWHDDRQDLCDRCSHTFLYYEHTGKTSLLVNGRFYNSENKQVTAYHTYDNNTHIGTIEIYDIVVKIYDVFDWGSTVTSVKIPHTVKELSETFNQCNGLKSVTLYEGLESISGSTFYKTPLTSITLPHSLKSIGGSAFQNCNNLTSLVMQSVPQIDGVWISGQNTTETVVLAEDSYVYKDSNPNFPTVASVTAPCALDLTGSAVENHPNLIHTGGQKIVDVAAVAPTCTTDGHTEGTHCNLCDKPLTVQQTIPATGHSFNNKTLTAEAVEDALYAYVCDNGCGEQNDAHVIKDYDGAGNNLELTKEASGNYTAYSVAIEDGKSFSTPVPFITKNVMMNRSFTDGIPSTIMLPFSIDASDFGDETPWGEKQGDFYFKFQSVTRNAETGKWEAIMTRVTDVIAYTPYVIVMYKKSTLGFGWNYYTMTFPATPAASGMITVDAETGWTLVGLNEKKVWTDGDEEIGKAYGFAGKNKDYDEYAVAKGDFVKIAAGASAKPGRCYLLKEGGILSNARGMTRAAEEEELPAVIQLRLVGSSTQGIGTINTETGEMTIEGWYDLNGNKIEEPSKGGVYIHNNKKVMVK